MKLDAVSDVIAIMIMFRVLCKQIVIKSNAFLHIFTPLKIFFLDVAQLLNLIYVFVLHLYDESEIMSLG